ncbi:MAG: anthranilate phosphoribosyltransferase [Planctomycetes bacterium]|nr:anthranilate phosphoribosyltransferase [Planctomycetota bacterium]
MLKELLPQVINKQSLRKHEAYAVMLEIISGTAEPAQIGAFLTAIKMKGETSDEIAGFAKAMREKMIAIKCASAEAPIDLCGTGGDMKCTLNISTLASFIAAACGVPVAKHGNRSVSSKCGSADVLEKLGAKINLTPESAEKCLNETGYVFLFAPNFHPAMKNVAPIRKALGIPTVFNLLGPLCNPARVKKQLIGIYDPALTDIIASALNELGHETALIVHSNDGMDEISPFAMTTGILLSNHLLSLFQYEPENASSAGSLTIKDADEGAKIFISVLKGAKGIARTAAILNAAAALFTAGKGSSISESIAPAAEAIDSGRALAKLNEFITLSNKLS